MVRERGGGFISPKIYSAYYIPRTYSHCNCSAKADFLHRFWMEIPARQKVCQKVKYLKSLQKLRFFNLAHRLLQSSNMRTTNELTNRATTINRPATVLSREQRELIREIQRLERQSQYLEGLRLKMINQPQRKDEDNDRLRTD